MICAVELILRLEKENNFETTRSLNVLHVVIYVIHGNINDNLN